MHPAKRYLLIALTFTLSAFVVIVCSPRVAHAVTAALVQVANPPSNPVMVRNIDEPARVPYFVSARPSCPYTNVCYLTGTTVPTGMRLRITHVSGVINANVSGYAALSIDNENALQIMLPLTSVNGGPFQQSVAVNHEVDVYVDEGHTPILQIGCPAGMVIYNVSTQNMIISGYLVPKEP